MSKRNQLDHELNSLRRDIAKYKGAKYLLGALSLLNYAYLFQKGDVAIRTENPLVDIPLTCVVYGVFPISTYVNSLLEKNAELDYLTTVIEGEKK